ncbi:hypothetical protein QBC43DRAFT_200204 [Cladorrhinum sp. PSN259]|nr:hypothetical protein QBC43DRAFT_200204 [Cladorrhinum sp. PSN259]
MTPTNASHNAPAYLHLFTSGCHISGHPTDETNCALACSDSTHLFGSLSTLGNCVTLATASLMVKENIISAESLDTSVLKSVGITETQQINGSAILSAVVQCAAASCQNSTFGYCSQNISDLANSTTVDFKSLRLFEDALSTYCDSVNVSVNADIAGPGVLSSLILQAIIAIVGFGIINILTSWVGAFAYLFCSLRSKKRPTTDVPGHKCQQKLRLSKFSTALISASMEFQEAQAFLTMAIQAATLATFRSLCGSECATLDSVTSVAESIMNSELVLALATNSILPVLLMQSVLQRIGLKWSYNLMLTVGTFIIAVVIEHQRAVSPTYEVLWEHLKTVESVEECGDNPSLMAFCLAATRTLGFRCIPTLGLAYPSISVLIIDQAFTTQYVKKLAQEAQNLRFVTPRKVFLAKLIFRIIWGGLEFMLVLNVAVHLHVLKGIADQLGMTSSQWSYGQVVSAMIWVPILGKLFYYNIFGVKGSCEARLLKDPPKQEEQPSQHNEYMTEIYR